MKAEFNSKTPETWIPGLKSLSYWIDGGFDLLELTPEKVNLEDIFLELTREGSDEGQSPVSLDTDTDESEA